MSGSPAPADGDARIAPPPPAPDEREIFSRRLATVSRLWKRRLDLRFHALGLTQARWSALLELSRHPEATQIELARALGIEAPTLVRLLDGLEAGGLVERHVHADDRRAKSLRLTAAARPLLARMHAIAAASRADFLRDIPPDDLRLATDVLDRIATRLETLNDDENG